MSIPIPSPDPGETTSQTKTKRGGGAPSRGKVNKSGLAPTPPLRKPRDDIPVWKIGASKMPLGRKQKQVLERLEGLRLPSSNLGLTRCMTPEFVRTLRLGGQRRCLHGSTRSELKTSVLIAGGIAAYATMIAREKNGTTCSFDLNTVSPSPGERRACTHYRRPVPDHHPKTSSDSQHAASRQHPVSSIETTTAAAVTLQFGNSVCTA